MFIRFFRSNQPATLFAIPLVALAFWLPAFFTTPLSLVVKPMPFYRLILDGLNNIPYSLQLTIGLSLIATMAIVFNYYINEFEVLSKKSYLPALFFILFTSASPGQLRPHAALFAGMIVVLITGNFLKLYKNDHSAPLAFNTAFLSAVVTLIYFPSIIYLLILYLAIIILRPFVWREWFNPLIGFCLPFLFTWVFYFWNDCTDLFYNYFYLPNTHTVFISLFQEAGWKLFFPSVIVFSGLLALNKFATLFFKSVIRTRLYQQLLLVSMPALLSLLFFTGVSYQELSVLIAMPLSVVFSSLFLTGKRMFWLETLFLFILASVVILHVF